MLGTLIGIIGAMLLTLYKGVEIKIWSTHVDLLHHAGVRHMASSNAGKRLIGSLLALGSCLSYALWLIVQVNTGNEFICICIIN